MSAAPLTGQVAVVTGASRGLGKAIAVHLAARAQPRPGSRGRARIWPRCRGRPTGQPGRLLAYPADVTSAGEVEAVFTHVDTDLGTPQLVVAGGPNGGCPGAAVAG